MQEPVLIFKNMDTGGEQFIVITSAGSGDNPGIIARRDNQRGVDAAPGARA